MRRAIWIVVGVVLLTFIVVTFLNCGSSNAMA